MNKRKYGWKMKGWMKGSIGARWKDRWKAVYVKGKGWMNGWIKGSIGERMNKNKYRWKLKGWMNKWMNERKKW